METDQLIRTLAADNAHRARPVGFVLALALLAAAPLSVAMFLAGLGVRPDVMTAMHNPFFDLKFAVTLALAIPAIAISLSAGFPGLDTWYVYGKEKYGFELGGGCTAVSAPGLYPLIDTGQINGLLGGLRGAAEYETLVGMAGKATAGMDAQSATHFLIIILIVVCNLFYFLTGQEGRRRG